MNTETLEQLSGQIDAAQQSLNALTDPDKIAATVQQALDAPRAAKAYRRARNRADKTVKSGQYVYTPKEYGNARITASGAVYIAAKVGWRRVKGQAAMDLKRMVAEQDARQAAAQAVVEGARS